VDGVFPAVAGFFDQKQPGVAASDTMITTAACLGSFIYAFDGKRR
jgi:hypothetical protein